MTENNLNIALLLTQLEYNLKNLLAERQFKNPVMVGIHTGGAWIAEQLYQRFEISEPLALMDISFYRDDFSQIGMHPKIKPSQIPLSLEGRDIILVDDVFYTGRTARAALNELFDFGRPNQVILAVLIERTGQQIPLKPDCVGTSIQLPKGTRIKLTGAEPLTIELHAIATP